jgi:23S rRNA G2445 N2-methylase RlmL
MTSAEKTKELYNQLRKLSCDELWETEVPAFDKAPPKERAAKVALVRAVGVVFSESGTKPQKEAVRSWLSALLKDPDEKIRRYAMAALPKLGASGGDEAELLALLKQTTVEREKKFLSQTLEKIGGEATLREVSGLSARTEQKVKASVARSSQPSSVRLDKTLAAISQLRIHLRGRDGLENIVRTEVEESIARGGKFRILSTTKGLVVLAPTAHFSLSDLYSLRCFGTIGFVLGKVPGDVTNALPEIITAPATRRILEAFTEGSIRYRIEFIGKGHQRAAVREIATRAYERCPDILNDSQQAPWMVEVRSETVELRPRISPDPRFAYRQHDVPAASHPPLAACIARLAGRMDDEVVWDPFCGSGVELVERAMLGGVRELHGTDLSEPALDFARKNIVAAGLQHLPIHLTCCDFREYRNLRPGSATLVISNPPMGRRVPIPNMRGLFQNLLEKSAEVLKPGGRLIFPNPLKMDTPPRGLALVSRQPVDLGGFECKLELYRKS